MPKKDPLPGRYGALKSWGNTVDRSARTARARANSPASVGYWLARLDPVRFAHATDEQKLAAADAALRAHFAYLSMLAAQSKRAA